MCSGSAASSSPRPSSPPPCRTLPAPATSPLTRWTMTSRQASSPPAPEPAQRALYAPPPLGRL
eukprot:2801391-Pyramimonas_sp.AAC.1